MCILRRTEKLFWGWYWRGGALICRSRVSPAESKGRQKRGSWLPGPEIQHWLPRGSTQLVKSKTAKPRPKTMTWHPHCTYWPSAVAFSYDQMLSTLMGSIANNPLTGTQITINQATFFTRFFPAHYWDKIKSLLIKSESRGYIYPSTRGGT